MPWLFWLLKVFHTPGLRAFAPFTPPLLFCHSVEAASSSSDSSGCTGTPCTTLVIPPSPDPCLHLPSLFCHPTSLAGSNDCIWASRGALVSPHIPGAVEFLGASSPDGQLHSQGMVTSMGCGVQMWPSGGCLTNVTVRTGLLWSPEGINAHGLGNPTYVAAHSSGGGSPRCN